MLGTFFTTRFFYKNKVYKNVRRKASEAQMLS